MAKTKQILRAAQDSNTPLRFRNTVDEDTSAVTFLVYLVDPDDTTTKIQIGSGLGAAIGTDFSIACDFSTNGVTPKVWLLYVTEDTVSPTKITACPNKKTADLVYIDVYENPTI